MSSTIEKQAILSGLLKSLKAGVKKVAPVVGAGGVGVGVGRYTGHQAGYEQGSAEGGRDSIKNLYRGLYDLMQQGRNSKTDLGEVLDIQKPGIMDKLMAKESAEKVKLARHVLNLHAINQELQTYSVKSWKKAASEGFGRELRIKYAALRLQQLVEKQAVLGSLIRLGAKGLGAGFKGLQGLGSVAASGANAAKPHLQQALQAGGRGVADAIKANPVRSAAGMGILGAGAGLAAPSAYDMVNRNAIQPTMEAGRAVANTAQEIGTRLGNAGDALFGIRPDFAGVLRNSSQLPLRSLPQNAQPGSLAGMQ